MVYGVIYIDHRHIDGADSTEQRGIQRLIPTVDLRDHSTHANTRSPTPRHDGIVPMAAHLAGAGNPGPWGLIPSVHLAQRKQ